LKIVLFHPVRLPPKDYGGVERVVLWLARGLRDRGHEVFVAALTGSELEKGVQLLPLAPGAVCASDLWRVLPKGVDLVHFMAPASDMNWEDSPAPSLLTVHGNGKPGEAFPQNSVFLSSDHAKRHSAKVFVHNGIDPAEYLFEPSRKSAWNLFLSKTSWTVKNLAGAIRYCRRAGVPLSIAGGNRPLHLRAWAALNPNLHWVGPVAGRKKAELLAHARALVFPVKWSEPFGLVVAEALISGTPVLASPWGSLPELLSPRVGKLLHSEGEWVDALRGNLDWADPEECRQHALSKFHFLTMAASYEKLYESVRRGDRLHEAEPYGAGNEAQSEKGVVQ
jgi:glycosyltransferase involved in cell wall biosynthesis